MKAAELRAALDDIEVERVGYKRRALEQAVDGHMPALVALLEACELRESSCDERCHRQGWWHTAACQDRKVGAGKLIDAAVTAVHAVGKAGA